MRHALKAERAPLKEFTPLSLQSMDQSEGGCKKRGEPATVMPRQPRRLSAPTSNQWSAPPVDFDNNGKWVLSTDVWVSSWDDGNDDEGNRGLSRRYRAELRRGSLTWYQEAVQWCTDSMAQDGRALHLLCPPVFSEAYPTVELRFQRLAIEGLEAA
jgi:hypothetical protein